MKPNFKNLFLFALFVNGFLFSQRIESENITVNILQEPIYPAELQNRNYSVTVNSTYNITKEDVLKKSKEDFEKQLDTYNINIEAAKNEYQGKLDSFDMEVKKLTDKYKTESDQFNKLSTIEKLAVTTGPPTLKLPVRPELHLRPVPKYYEPDLRNALIVDNKVLESQINIDGLSKSGKYLEILVDIDRTKFQDNAGKTFANQPTHILVKQNGVVKLDKIYFNEFEQVSSSPSNEVNLSSLENQFLQKIINKINSVLNENFGYQAKNTFIKLETVKNKGDYDDLEKASMYVATNLRKLQAKPDYEPNKAAMENMQKGINIWKDILAKIDYKDKKALLNEKIASYVYMNMIRLNLALGNKKEAEKYLNDMQEHLVNIKLSYDQERELNNLETTIYK